MAAFDVSRVAEYLEVRYATVDESYVTFSGDVEHPDAHEVIFADGAGRAHARRWTNRQSGYSAVQDATTAVLIVAEALHRSARADVQNLITTLADEVASLWSVTPRTALLSQSAPRFAV